MLRFARGFASSRRPFPPVLSPSRSPTEVPGGTTGLLVKDYKGKDADTLVYKVDTGLLAELRNHEKQAAEELGQWSEKRKLPEDALQNEITIRFVRPGEALPSPEL